MTTSNKSLQSTSTQPKKEKKEKRWTWKRPKDKPKRPPSAYNLFFQDVRRRLLDEKRSDGLQQSVSKKKGQSSNGLGFKKLATVVSEEWKRIDPSKKAPYEKMASIEKEKYKIALKEWQQIQAEKKANEESKEQMKDSNKDIEETPSNDIGIDCNQGPNKLSSSSSSSSITSTTTVDDSSVEHVEMTDKISQENEIFVPKKLNQTGNIGSNCNKIGYNHIPILSLASLTKTANASSFVRNVSLMETSTQSQQEDITMDFMTDEDDDDDTSKQDIHMKDLSLTRQELDDRINVIEMSPKPTVHITDLPHDIMDSLTISTDQQNRASPLSSVITPTTNEKVKISYMDDFATTIGPLPNLVHNVTTTDHQQTTTIDAPLSTYVENQHSRQEEKVKFTDSSEVSLDASAQEDDTSFVYEEESFESFLQKAIHDLEKECTGTSNIPSISESSINHLMTVFDEEDCKYLCNQFTTI